MASPSSVATFWLISAAQHPSAAALTRAHLGRRSLLLLELIFANARPFYDLSARLPAATCAAAA